MTGPAAVAGTVAAIIMTLAIGATGAGAQEGDEHLDLVDQTVFVGEDPAVIEVRVADVADDDRLTVRIFAPRTTRDAVRATYDGVTGEPSLSLFDATPPEGWTTGEVVRISPDDDEVGELLRRDPGALPVVIDLVTADGTVRDSLVTHLLVLDEGRRLSLGFVGDLRGPLARRADETAEIDGPALVARAEALTAHSVAVTVAIHAESLEALDATGDGASLDLLRDLLAPRPLLRTPWVGIDEEAWRVAGETDRVTDHYARGAAVIETELGTSPGTIVELDADATDATLGLLRTVGATGALVEPAQLAASTAAVAGSRPVQILDDNGLAMPVIAYDDDLHATLRTVDPELAGHRAVSELAVEAHGTDTDVAVVTRLDGVEPAAIAVVEDVFSSRSWLRIDPVARLFEVEPARRATGELFRGALRADPPPDLTGRAADLRLTEALVDAYATMVAPAEAPVAPLRTQLFAAAADDIDTDLASLFTTAVSDSVRAGTSGISVVPGERITLTDRRADLPLTLRNDQPLPITIELTLSAEKLRFPNGERVTVVLQPGDNERLIAVETLASGDARITATLTSPDGRLELGSGAVDIRSTAISGLGLIISIAALMVLAGWWARTIVRNRRARGAATVASAPDPGIPSTQGET